MSGHGHQAVGNFTSVVSNGSLGTPVHQPFLYWGNTFHPQLAAHLVQVLYCLFIHFPSQVIIVRQGIPW
jgi:hypothetical protein